MNNWKITDMKNITNKEEILKYLRKHNAEELYQESMNLSNTYEVFYDNSLSTKLAEKYLKRKKAFSLYQEGLTMNEAKKLWGNSVLSNEHVRRLLKRNDAMFLYHDKMTFNEYLNAIKNSKRYKIQQCTRLLIKEFGPKGGDYYDEYMDMGYIINKIIRPRREKGIGPYCGNRTVIFDKIYKNLKYINNNESNL